jgi:hypothetical protein
VISMSESANKPTILPVKHGLKDKYTQVYEEHPDLNILDISATGSGKTTQALQHIDYLVSHGKCAVMVMQSYDLLEEALDKLHRRGRAIIFKGKTQQDICPKYDEIAELYKYAIIGICGECNIRSDCEYYAQFERIKAKCKDNEGICIFTVKENVSRALELLDGKEVTIIVDDVPISSLITPTDFISANNLNWIADYLSEIESRLPGGNDTPSIIQTIVNAIQLKKDINQYLSEQYKRPVQDILEELDIELKYLSLSIREDIKSKEPPDLKIIYNIIKCIRENRPFDIRRKNGKIIYTEDNTEIYRKHRVVYLNATPASLETKESTPDNVNATSLFESLGGYYLFEEPVKDNRNWVILQVDTYKNGTIKFAKDTVSHSPILRDCILEILYLNDRISKFLGTDCLLIANKDAYYENTFGADIRSSGYAHKFEHYFGDGTRSTNQYRNARFCICVGNPCLPPDNYERSRYNKIRCNNGQYTVDNSVITIDSVNEIQQGFSRVMRGDPEISKLGIYFGDIDLGSSLPTNGAVVINGYDIHDEKARERFFNRAKRELQRIYKKPLTERLCQEIKRRLDVADHPLKLHTVAEEFVEEHNLKDIFSAKTIENYIKENFETATTQQGSHKRTYIFLKDCGFSDN